MKVLVILASLVAAVYGGVGVVTPQIEMEALRLWNAYCNGASEGGTDGSTFIYCKRSRENFEETLQHNVELPRGPAAQDQVVFVQPPSYNYKHDIVVTGGGGSAPRTVIYVKPSKNSHTINVNDQTKPSTGPAKPTLYFLRGNHGESESQQAAQPQAPPPPPQQQPQGGYRYNTPPNGLRYRRLAFY